MKISRQGMGLRLECVRSSISISSRKNCLLKTCECVAQFCVGVKWIGNNKNSFKH